MIGLVQAARAFDPGRGINFKSFAEPRIRGAILDWCRREDTLSRDDRVSVKKGLGSWTDTRGVPVRADGDLRELDSSRNETARPLDMPATRARQHESAEVAEVLVMLAQLPPRLALAIYLNVVLDMYLWRVGEILGVSEARAFQLVAEARVLLNEMRKGR